MKNNTSIIIIFFCLFFLVAYSDNREENTPKKLVTATTLLLPSDKQICMEMPITFSWKSVTNATSYNLTVNKVENGKETTVFTESTSNTNYSFNKIDEPSIVNNGKLNESDFKSIIEQIIEDIKNVT